MKHRLLFVMWAVDSVAWFCLLGYMFIHGIDTDTINLSKDLGMVWGATGAFLIGPAWKSARQWPASRRQVFLGSVIAAVTAIGLLFWLRSLQTAKLQALFEKDREFELTAAPKKQRFMELLNKKQNAKTLPEFLRRCADLEPATNDYETDEQQVDRLLGQMQQEIAALKPPGSYASLLPGFAVLRAVVAKDVAAAEAQKKEIDFAKQLPGIPETQRSQFYTANIQPVVKQEVKIAQEEGEILKDAKKRGVTLPASVYEGAGIK